MAVRAALEMRQRLQALNARREAAGKPALRNGIGIHTGTVLAGSIGGAERLSYALVGDPVNLASRIQGLTKDFKVEILISEATRVRLDGASPSRSCPRCASRGARPRSTSTRWCDPWRRGPFASGSLLPPPCAALCQLEDAPHDLGLGWLDRLTSATSARGTPKISPRAPNFARPLGSSAV
jgi:hypothetical protein